MEAVLTGAKQDSKFKKGVSGNPNGRPKGSFSIKSKIIKRLEANPKELKNVIDYLIDNEQALLFQMIDGRPQQDVVSDGKALPTPILAALPADDYEERSTE